MKRNRRQEEPKITNINGRKLLRRPSYWTESPFQLCILLGEHDTKLLRKMPLLLEWGHKMDFLCTCSRNCIITVIINIIVYIAVVVVCQNCQVNEPNKCKHQILDTLHYSIFLCFFATQSYIQNQM